MAKETNEVASFSSKAMLLENAKAGTKIKYADRLMVEIIKDTRHYRVGMKVSPHKVKGLALISQGIAKEVK